MITIVRPGVAKPRIRSKPVEPPLILSVGIQHPRKGHDILIAALERLRHVDWTAVIVGSAWDPAHAEELALQAAKSGLGPRLRLEGRVDDAKLEELYSKAGIFALATRYEGYGIVFDEALTYGLPIVSCRAGAVPDTVPADAGLLVPTDDSPAFANALADLLENRDRRAALAGAAKRAGVRLPDWNETARIAGAVLGKVSAEMGAIDFQ
jgi:glycosyltransferase involved in cell wall biosynthesis